MAWRWVLFPEMAGGHATYAWERWWHRRRQTIGTVAAAWRHEDSGQRARCAQTWRRNNAACANGMVRRQHWTNGVRVAIALSALSRRLAPRWIRHIARGVAW